MGKPAIALDFDGVLHSYSAGWTGLVPDQGPVPGALEFVQLLIEKGYEPVVISTRALLDKRGAEEIRQWLSRNGFPSLRVSHKKLDAELYIDDRGYRFEGNFDDVMGLIETDLRTWHRK